MRKPSCQFVVAALTTGAKVGASGLIRSSFLSLPSKYHKIPGLLNALIKVFCLLVCSAGSLHASQEEEFALTYGDEDLLTIATGAQQPIAKAPAVASVITEAEIKKLGAKDIDEVLETIPGLHVARSTRLYNPIYIVRGIYSETNPQVLLLVNGIPITNIFIGDRSQVWGGMPIKDIARIEVIRGPGSAVYGADAFSGVINILTKNTDDINGTEVGGRVGSKKNKKNKKQHRREYGGIKTAFSIEYGS